LLPTDLNVFSTENFKRKKKEEEEVAERGRGRENNNDLECIKF